MLLGCVCRNVCKHCKCLRQIHDVTHSDFVNVWERLSLPQPADPERWMSKEKAHKLGYAWVPAGLDAKQASCTRSFNTVVFIEYHL